MAQADNPISQKVEAGASGVQRYPQPCKCDNEIPMNN